MPLEGGAQMSELSMKALQILQALDTKIEFLVSDLTAKGFSESSAKFVINELEENNYIFITKTFINGNVAFVLV